MAASSSPSRSSTGSSWDNQELIFLLGLATGIVVLGWLGAHVPPLLTHGTWAPIGPVEALGGWLRLVVQGHWSDPGAAFEGPAAELMPGPLGFWASFLGPLAGAIALVFLLYRRTEGLTGSTRLGRRFYDPRGSRSEEWARPRHVRSLVVPERQPDRWTLGRLDGRLLASDAEAHLAAVMPTRSGKTTSLAIPYVLEHSGPVVVTSTKADILEATLERRRTRGRVWIFDPFGRGEQSAGFTPLLGCEEWSAALRAGRRLADAAGDDQHGAARFWNHEAAQLFGPLLHAAALGRASMDVVLRWLDGQHLEEPAEIIRRLNGHEAAAEQLAGIDALDSRNKGTLFMSAKALLSAYRYPEVQEATREDLTPAAFYDGRPNTVYVVAPASDQELLAPLVVALLGGLFDGAELRRRRNGRSSTTTRFVLDEVANIAPLRSLPRRLSLAAADDVRIATFWQTVGQMERLGRGAGAEILGNSTAKVFGGPITDEATRRTVTELLGQEETTATSRSSARWGAGGSVTECERREPKATAQALQQLERGRHLVVHGTDVPFVPRFAPWWEDRSLSPPRRRPGAPARL